MYGLSNTLRKLHSRRGCLAVNLSIRGLTFQRDMLKSKGHTHSLNRRLGEIGDYVNDFFRAVDRIIAGIQRETVRGLIDFTYLFAAQAFLDALVTPYGFLVDVCFMAYTGFGFYDELRQVLSARTVVRLVLAIFAFLLDLGLTLNLR